MGLVISDTPDAFCGARMLTCPIWEYANYSPMSKGILPLLPLIPPEKR